MFNKPFKEITMHDIENLIFTRKERENNYLDYKEKLGNSDRDKREFLKDVSGFANASGGFLIIGVKEHKKSGIPEKIIGIEKTIGNQKIDEWIDNVLLSNLDERIRYNLKIFELKDKDEKILLVLYVPESPKKPHMITFQGKNNYYIRHNTLVNPATQSEVREMFEYSKKIINTLEEFLRIRNLYNEHDKYFGINDNSIKLYNEIHNIKTRELPFILCSFIPKYLYQNRINTASQDFISWLETNKTGFEPASKTELFYFNKYQKIIKLDGIIFPNTLNNAKQLENQSYLNYFEFLNNGFFESGVSSEIIFLRNVKENPPIEKTFVHLSRTIGYVWMLFGFARSFFENIKYYDEVIFQLSVVNVKHFTLAGFVEKWAEPFSAYYSNPPFCSHDKFKIIEKFMVSEISQESIKDMIMDLASKLSYAFGESEIKCFNKEGNFNKHFSGWHRR
jgi:hypothetical protein